MLHGTRLKRHLVTIEIALLMTNARRAHVSQQRASPDPQNICIEIIWNLEVSGISQRLSNAVDAQIRFLVCQHAQSFMRQYKRSS